MFMNKLQTLLEEHSLERFGVQMYLKQSTVDEYLKDLS